MQKPGHATKAQVKQAVRKQVEQLLTPQQAARMLGVSVQRLMQLVNNGTLHPIRTPGGHRRYLYSEIKDFFSKLEFPVALYIHVQPYAHADEAELEALRQAAERSRLVVREVIEESTSNLVLPLPERPGFLQLVNLASERKIRGFLVDAVPYISNMSVVPWLLVLARLGLVCFEVPRGTEVAVPFPYQEIEW